ncbi:MAG TPA: hypothetical protein VL328_10780 [Gemmatimonadaceae bacterium]|nr:hypothetical protein [Gemmatimonadaceae bacterium]
MNLLAVVLFAQLAAPASTPLRGTPPVLSFPQAGLDDPAAYEGYRTRLFRDAAGNTVQIYLDARAQRVVHLWADAENESIGFTARGGDGNAAALRWNGPGALVGRAGTARIVEHRLVADDARIALGWFLLGSMRVERDLQYAKRQLASFADAPFELPEIERLLHAIASLPPAERERHLALLHAPSVAALRARTMPTVAATDSGPVHVVRVTQPALDALDTLVLELRTDPRLVRAEIAGDSVVLRALAGRTIPFTVRIESSGRPLTPLARNEIFDADFLAWLARTRARAATAGPSSPLALRAQRVERQVRGLELLASREKLMAGLPTYATYFGRDMLMTALMMRPVWRPEMAEFVIASALRKLSPEGRVSHEEALGGQAVREAAAEYAALVERSATAAPAQADSLLARASTVLRELRRVRENYHMIDAEFQFPIVVARWLDDPRVSADRKRAFLLDSSDGGGTRIARLSRELELLATLTAPYVDDPRPKNLVSFAPRDSGRWASQSWRDSNVGYAGGRYAMDVNALWAPHALEALDRILEDLRTLGILTIGPRNLAPSRGLPFDVYVRAPSSLRHAIDVWRGASRHFLVQCSGAEVREQVGERLDSMPAAERRYWTGVLQRTGAGRDSLEFLALSLDADGYPIGVANSDVATRLFLLDPPRAGTALSAAERAAVLRDVRLFARHYPVGLLVDGVGPVVANDAYASPRVWRDFERDRYHGPRVVWGRENNLFLLGAMARARDVAGVADPALAAYRREIDAAVDRVRSAVEASGFHSELWSYELRDGRVVPVRYGSGSDVQLWSTTDLVVGYTRDRGRGGRATAPARGSRAPGSRSSPAPPATPSLR